MKKLVSTARVLLLISFSFCFSFAKSAPSKEARELIGVIGYERNVNVVASQRLDEAIKSGKISASVDRAKFVNTLRQKYYDIGMNNYGAAMSTTEMKSTVAFFNSAAGKKFLSVIPMTAEEHEKAFQDTVNIFAPAKTP